MVFLSIHFFLGGGGAAFVLVISNSSLQKIYYLICYSYDYANPTRPQQYVFVSLMEVIGLYVTELIRSVITYNYTRIYKYVLVECHAGFYGKDCMNQCSVNCNVTSLCNKFTGKCDGGCKPGWTGPACNFSKKLSGFVN